MRNRAIGLLVAVLVAAALAPAHAEDAAAVRKALQAQYDKQAQALKRRDTKGVLAPLASNFSMKAPNGQTIGRQHIELMLNMQLGQVASVSQATIKITALQVKGSTAVATTTQRFKASTRPDPQGKAHAVSQTTVGKDTWSKTAQGWRIVGMAPTKSSVTVDGKPMGPAGGGARP